MNVGMMQTIADNMNKELLEMISNLSDGTNSDNASSVGSLWYNVVPTLTLALPNQMYHTFNGSQMR
jgi:hypothetical protein